VRNAEITWRQLEGKVKRREQEVGAIVLSDGLFIRIGQLESEKVEVRGAVKPQRKKTLCSVFCVSYSLPKADEERWRARELRSKATVTRMREARGSESVTEFSCSHAA